MFFVGVVVVFVAVLFTSRSLAVSDSAGGVAAELKRRVPLAWCIVISHSTQVNKK